MARKQLKLPLTSQEQLKFPLFLDRNVSSDVMAQLLAESGLKIHRHHDHFDAEEDDDTIIRTVSKRGWLLVAGDKNIETDHIYEIWQASARVVLFSENNSGPVAWTGILALHCHKIFDRFSDAKDGAMIVRLGKAGISLVRTHDQIEERFRKLEDSEVLRLKRGQPINERTARRAGTHALRGKQ